MKKIFLIISVVSIFTALCGCEVDIIPPNVTNNNNSITVTALAVAGQPLNARVSWAEKISDATSDHYDDRYIMWRFLNMLDTINFTKGDSIIFENYYKKKVITDAKVCANINGQEFEMKYNPSTLNYEYNDYNLNPRDRITINVETLKLEDEGETNIIKASSQIEVPSHIADVEIIKTNKIYKELEKYKPLGAAEFGIDSVVVFTLKLKSTNPGINCFRLKISSIEVSFYSEDFLFPSYIMSPISVYNSNDVLLYDSTLDKGFGPWPAYLTDVFTDESFNNGEYIIDVTSRIISHNTGYYDDESVERVRYFEIELQPITPILLNYLSVLYRLRIATPSYFSEPSSLPSNIEGGVGVFGGIGKSAKIRYFFPGEENPKIPVP